MKQKLNTIKLTDEQLEQLKAFLKYAYNHYVNSPTMKEDVEIKLLELIAEIRSQNK